MQAEMAHELEAMHVYVSSPRHACGLRGNYCIESLYQTVYNLLSNAVAVDSRARRQLQNTSNLLIAARGL